MSNGYLLHADGVPSERREAGVDEDRKYGSGHAFLDGNLARRRVASIPFVWWDTAVRGFGLSTTPAGAKSWILHYRRRGKQVRKVLGRAEVMNAAQARAAACSLLAEEALDGLPQPIKASADKATLFGEFAPTFLAEYGRHWKPSTLARNRAIIKELTSVFGECELAAIRRADVLQWRDASVVRQARFNRSIPVLSVLMQYAEKAGMRLKGSNPCKGTPRYKRELPDRFLSAGEYRRLARALVDAEEAWPAVAAAIRLLLYTGARKGEIEGLRWEWVQPPRLMLPDSKTGPKIILLNRQAQSILERIALEKREGLVFAAQARAGGKGGRPLPLDYYWSLIRKQAALPDVRLHDLRHSFASIAIADGISLMQIGRLLGHALPETTARYAHLADDTVAAAAERVSGSIARCLGLAA